MWKDSYLQNQVMTADPMELVRMLYRAAVDATRDARKHLASGAIRKRSDAINRALAIVGELSLSLDHTTGGEISRNLAGLYAYLVQLLMRANIRQEDASLAEAETLLTTLTQAWEHTKATESAEERQPAAARPQLYQGSQSQVQGQAHNWSA